MKKKQISLALFFCALVPLLGIINSINDIGFQYGKALFSWIVITAYLFSVWQINLFINTHFQSATLFVQRAYMLLANLAYICLFTSIYLPFVPFEYKSAGHVTASLLFFRLSAANVIIIAVQQTLKIMQQKEAIRLQNQELKNENLAARFEILKQQINPHFLFNALSTLRTMVRSGDEKAETFIIKLAEIYRELLNKRESTTVTLREEMDFLHSYIFMLKARFEDMLHIEIAIADENLSREIPPFGLQLLIENCIKHNIVSASRPLNIRIYQPDDSLIAIENNLQPKTIKEESQGVGLENLRKRYELMNIKDGVIINQSEDIFSISLRLL